QLSVAGPGWYPLWHENITASAAMTTGSDNSLSLDSSAGNAFVIYSVGGFSGDFSPTSMRNMLASGAQPQYFFMAANYESMRWQPIGPLSGNFTGELPGLEDATFLPADYISPSGNVHLAMLLPEGNGSLGLQQI